MSDILADFPAKLIRGDCLSVLRAMPSGETDAIITDPPYGIDFQSGWCKARKGKILNDRLPFIWWLWDAARVLKDGGLLLCFCHWQAAEVFRLAIELAGLKIRGQLVWDRVGHGAGDTATCPAPRHELIWYATKGRRVFPNGYRPSSVIRITHVDRNAISHPSEKPIELLQALIEDYTSPEEVILDPFAGSGTTGVAAASKRRNSISIELDSKYAEVARVRLATFQSGPAECPLFQN